MRLLRGWRDRAMGQTVANARKDLYWETAEERRLLELTITCATYSPPSSDPPIKQVVTCKPHNRHVKEQEHLTLVVTLHLQFRS